MFRSGRRRRLCGTLPTEHAPQLYTLFVEGGEKFLTGAVRGGSFPHFGELHHRLGARIGITVIIGAETISVNAADAQPLIGAAGARALWRIDLIDAAGGAKRGDFENLAQITGATHRISPAFRTYPANQPSGCDQTDGELLLTGERRIDATVRVMKVSKKLPAQQTVDSGQVGVMQQQNPV